mgnify:CR=1 FL=1
MSAVLKPVPVPTAESAVLTKATLRAAERLGLAANVLSGIIGLSEASLSRMRSGRYQLEPGSKPFELALLFLRLFRSLDALWGHEGTARAWLASYNTSLGAAPLELIRSAAGLVRVVDYLDHARGRV